MTPEHLHGALEALGRANFVDLSTGIDGGWRLVITRRAGGYSASTYRGTLAEVVARAVAGIQPDLRSR